MPVLRCQKDGKQGFKWGSAGVCFTSGKDGKSPRERALSVGRAIAAERARRMGKHQRTGIAAQLIYKQEPEKLNNDRANLRDALKDNLGER